MHRPPACESGGSGRRARFRILCPQGRGGSSPPFRTNSLICLPRSTSAWGLLARFARGVYPPSADSRTPTPTQPTSLAAAVNCCRRPVCSRASRAAARRRQRVAVSRPPLSPAWPSPGLRPPRQRPQTAAPRRVRVPPFAPIIEPQTAGTAIWAVEPPVQPRATSPGCALRGGHLAAPAGIACCVLGRHP